MADDARRGHRRRREHDSPARRRALRDGLDRAPRARPTRSRRVTSRSAAQFRATGSRPRGASRGSRRRTRTFDCARLEIVDHSPGRQAENADELVASLERVRGATVRVLTAEEEAVLRVPRRVRDGRRPACERCRVRRGRRLDAARGRLAADGASLGALARRRLAAPHAPRARAAIRRRGKRSSVHARNRAALRRAHSAAAARRFATGGSARALAKLVGRNLGPEELAVALHIVAERPLAQAREDVRPLAGACLRRSRPARCCSRGAASTRRPAHGRARRAARRRRALAVRRPPSRLSSSDATAARRGRARS